MAARAAAHTEAAADSERIKTQVKSKKYKLAAEPV